MAAARRKAGRSKAGAKAAARGRPRSPQAHRAILRAVVELVLAGETLSGLSMEAVAARAKVGKATIYRRWQDKGALILEAFTSHFHTPLPALEGVSVRDDLVRLLEAWLDRDPAESQRVFLAMASDAKHFPSLNQRYRAAVVEPWTLALRAVLQRGLAHGELAPGTDLERVHTLLIAPVQVQMLVKGARDPLPPNFPRFVVETVLRGLAPAGGK